MSSLRVCYQTIEFGNVDIHLRTLRDRQQFLDEDGEAERLGISSANWPLFGIIWTSGEVLAHHMFQYDIRGKRILEIGCGIALASLVLNYRQADITATDQHPEAERFLIENVNLNQGNSIPFVRTGWADTDSGLGNFDLIIGSDILYEQGHAELVAAFVHQHAKLHCEVIIVDPGRSQRTKFRKQMERHGFVHSQARPNTIESLKAPFHGFILKYAR